MQIVPSGALISIRNYTIVPEKALLMVCYFDFILITYIYNWDFC